MFDSKKKGIIVLGGHIQALGIIRILGRDEIPGIVIDNTQKNLARHSKFCAGFYQVKDENLLEFLNELGMQKKYNKWIIFPTNDFHVKLLSINKSVLEKHFIITIDKWETIEIFYNKRNTYSLAKEIGIPIPDTWFPASEEDLHNIKIDFPCIIKPAVMHDFYRKVKKKVFICRNFNELLENYRKALSIIPYEEIIIQEIIPGPSKNQFSACFLFLNGQSYVSLTACRMRQHPVDFGNATTYAETVAIPLLKEYGEKILKEAGYNGLCEVEFKKDERDGTYKFLEVNTRTWKWHSIANKIESPFLPLYYKYLNSENIVPTVENKQASFRHALTDFPMQVLLLVRGLMYCFRVKRPVEKAVFSIKDIKPWIFEKIYLLNFLSTR